MNLGWPAPGVSSPRPTTSSAGRARARRLPSARSRMRAAHRRPFEEREIVEWLGIALVLGPAPASKREAVRAATRVRSWPP